MMSYFCLLSWVISIRLSQIFLQPHFIMFQKICCLSLFLGSLVQAQIFTSLDIDNHPCKPENLKHTNRYICDGRGRVICQSGWRNPLTHESLHDLNPCLEPICDADGIDCQHGECRAPNFCACEVGWEGSKCNQCIPLPGCEHGDCSDAFECNCALGWTGAYCDIAACDDCFNGDCIAPGECVCRNGWTGHNCATCEPMAGCLHGTCVDHPNTCECYPGWEGLLCDKPVCTPECIHGFCHSTTLSNGTILNQCICQPGWRGETCDQCRPYWICPNQGQDSCKKPNECFCHADIKDNLGLCNNTLINSVTDNADNHEVPRRDDSQRGKGSRESFMTGGHGKGNPNVPKEFTIQLIPQEPVADQNDGGLILL